MPIYEYLCQDCGKRNSFLIMKVGMPLEEKCRKCGSANLTRIMSRFAAVRSEESRLESLADPSKWRDLDENDPKSMVKFMKRMGKEMGEDLGEDFDQMIDEAEQEAYKGQSSSQEEDENYRNDQLTVD